jgi:hypothetical protein
METAIYSDYEPKRVKRSVRRESTGEVDGAGGSVPEENGGAFGFEAGEMVRVQVALQQPRNPRMIYCTLKAPDGLEHRISVRVGKSANFRPGMELELRVPLATQEKEPWPYDGPLPRFRGIWGNAGPRGVRA